MKPELVQLWHVHVSIRINPQLCLLTHPCCQHCIYVFCYMLLLVVVLISSVLLFLSIIVIMLCSGIFYLACLALYIPLTQHVSDWLRSVYPCGVYGHVWVCVKHINGNIRVFCTPGHWFLEWGICTATVHPFSGYGCEDSRWWKCFWVKFNYIQQLIPICMYQIFSVSTFIIINEFWLSGSVTNDHIFLESQKNVMMV